MKRFIRIFVFIYSAATLSIAAQSAEHEIEHGTDGLTQVPLSIANTGKEAMACKVSLAHWYSAEIGHAAPGKKVTGDLWSDPTNGTVYYLNVAGDRMPVERLWCGPEGESWQSRFEISLERKAGELVEPIHLKCSEKKSSFSCKAG